jgi:hypothetical protein
MARKLATDAVRIILVCKKKRVVHRFQREMKIMKMTELAAGAPVVCHAVVSLDAAVNLVNGIKPDDPVIGDAVLSEAIRTQSRTAPRLLPRATSPRHPG